ncbi:MAG: RnfH family protein [Porticoccus sp.]|jgi:putative ubiquitin-RnfH superfamily antitoxin RatB of RatAB toxin-antitoxin module|nr:RnfH family protein [Porticoccus sp.]|tara:strand:- start:991 stop:1305 length:315 start_codon:yes stop_codon:yes gene_type:complete
MTLKSYIFVEIAYALPKRQKIVELQVPAGTTAFDAVKTSGIVDEFPEIDIENAKMGIFGKLLGTRDSESPKERVLKNMDRVEIYRPLILDPKEIRKVRAKNPRT